MGDPVKLAQGLKTTPAAAGIQPPAATAGPAPSPAPLDLELRGLTRF